MTASTQLDFEFLVPVKKELLTVDEVADFLRLESKTSVYALILTGDLEVFRKPNSERSHQRITRRSLLAYFLKCSTQPAGEYVNTLIQLARTLPPGDRRKLGMAILQS